MERRKGGTEWGGEEERKRETETNGQKDRQKERTNRKARTTHKS